jgi:hypothetical protein
VEWALCYTSRELFSDSAGCCQISKVHLVEPRGTAVALTNGGGSNMLWTIFIVLLVLWLLGMVTSTTMGGFIHILLVIAIVVVLIRVIQGRRPIA